MDGGDFFSSEQSTTVKDATDVVIEHTASDGTITVLKQSTKVSPHGLVASDSIAILLTLFNIIIQ
jgi:isocitrate dehydrogenase